MNPQRMKSRQFNKKRNEVEDYAIYSQSMITRSVSLPIISVGENLDDTIRQKIQDEYEGKCVVEGYIRPGSSKIITYSSGIVRGGYVIFEVLFECDTCLPVEGMKINCIANNITKAGIRANIANLRPSPAVIFITRDHHYDNDYFNNINEGDTFVAIVIGQRFELNDKFVSIIARLETSNDYKRSMKRTRKDIGKKTSYIEEDIDDKDFKFEPETNYYAKAVPLPKKLLPLPKKIGAEEEIMTDIPADYEEDESEDEIENEVEEDEKMTMNEKPKARIVYDSDED